MSDTRACVARSSPISAQGGLPTDRVPIVRLVIATAADPCAHEIQPERRYAIPPGGRTPNTENAAHAHNGCPCVFAESAGVALLREPPQHPPRLEIRRCSSQETTSFGCEA